MTTQSRDAQLPGITPSSCVDVGSSAGMGSSAEYVAHVPTCVLALGDVHGDLQQAEAALRLVGATNETGEWAAGSCTLVQTGDLVDRGPDSFAVLQRFDALAAEAAEAGGAVVTLLGNHELFSLQVWGIYTRRKCAALCQVAHCMAFCLLCAMQTRWLLGCCNRRH